jgi:hypothetical protein
MAKLTSKHVKLAYMLKKFHNVYWCNEIKVASARSEVLMAVNMKSAVF